MRDFEQDRRICEAASKGKWINEQQNVVVNGYTLFFTYMANQSDAAFVAAAREGWPAALDEIQSLKLQLLAAGVFAASQPHCPDGKDCDGYSTSEQSCTACWLEYWRQKAGEGEK